MMTMGIDVIDSEKGKNTIKKKFYFIYCNKKMNGFLLNVSGDSSSVKSGHNIKKKMLAPQKMTTMRINNKRVVSNTFCLHKRIKNCLLKI